jgi:hypothetical protein
MRYYAMEKKNDNGLLKLYCAVYAQRGCCGSHLPQTHARANYTVAQYGVPAHAAGIRVCRGRLVAITVRTGIAEVGQGDDEENKTLLRLQRVLAPVIADYRADVPRHAMLGLDLVNS